MNHRVKRVLALCLSLLLATPFLSVLKLPVAIAESAFSYSLDSDGNATITKYEGDASAVTVPSSIDGHPVTAISGAFSNNATLTSVTISEGISKIDSSAFYHCCLLSQVHFPSTLTEIGPSAFCGCSSITSLTIPDNVKTIGHDAFSGCSALSYLKLSENLEIMDYYAFSSCDSLTSVTIPKNVRRAGAYHAIGYYFNDSDSAFSNCASLKEIRLADGIGMIPAYLFCDFQYIDHFVIPDSAEAIGLYAFANSGIKSVSGGSYTTLSSYAFTGCEQLESVSLSENTDVIGYEAFYGCSALRSIRIPDSVTRINENAFGQCTALSDVTLSKNLEKMEPCAFSSCDSLEEILIPKSLKEGGGTQKIGYYFQEERGAFYNCGALNRVTFEEGITEIAHHLFCGCTGLKEIVIPDTVATISYRAFQNASALENVTIGENVTLIGNYAFNDCDALTSVTIPASVTSLNNAFSYSDNLSAAIFLGDPPRYLKDNFGSCAENFAIYYYPDHTAAWAPNGETERDGYRILPISERHPSDALLLTVLGEDLSPMSNMVVRVTGNGIDQTVTTTTDGMAAFADLADGDYSVEVSEGNRGRTVQMFPNVPLKNGVNKPLVCKLEVNAGRPSAVVSMDCNGTDIVKDSLRVSIRESNNLILSPSFGSLDTSKIQEIEFLQSGSVIASCRVGQSVALQASNLKTDVPIWYRLQYTDKTCSKAKKLRLTTYNPSNVICETTWNEMQENEEFKLMNKIEFTVPRTSAILPGETISLDLGYFPISASRTADGTWRIGIGTKNIFDWENDEMFGKLKTATLKKDMKEAGELLKNKGNTGWKGKAEFRVFGYAEAKEGSSFVNGVVVIVMKGSYGQEWQFLAGPVPIVLKAKVGVEGEFTGKIGYDFGQKKWNFGAALKLTVPTIMISGGVGIAKIVDLSVYGSGKNIITLDFLKGYTSAALTGEAGVSFKLLFFEEKFPLVQGTWTYYEHYRGRNAAENPFGKMYDSTGYRIASRDYLERQTKWQGDIGKRDLLNARETTMLQGGVYAGALPETAAANGKTVMVYLADDGSRTTGNHSMLVYSTYDEATDTWSEPRPVWDDGTADFNPSLATDGNDVIAVWSDANTTFDEDASMDEVAGALEISYARLTYEDGEWTVAETKRLTDNEVADLQPCAISDHGTVRIVWQRNSENDLLNQTGSNRIVTCTPDGAETVLKTLEQPIGTIAAGMVNDVAKIAYLADMDGDLETSADTEVFLGGFNGSFERLTNDEINESAPKFVRIGTKEYLAWLHGEVLRTFDGTNASDYESDEPISPDFRIVSNGATTYLITHRNDETCGELYISRYSPEDQSWSGAIRLTGTEGYAEAPTGVVTSENGLAVVFTRTDAEITEDGIETNTDLYSIRMRPAHNLTLDAVDFKAKEIVPGEEIPVTLQVTNNGDLAETGFIVTVAMDGTEDQTFALTESLATGETKELEILMQVPETLTGSDCVVTVSASDDEFDRSDNTVTRLIRMADLEITAEKLSLGDALAVQATIRNSGFAPADATLELRRDDPLNGEVAATIPLGTLQPNELISRNFRNEELRQLMDGSEMLYFCVTANVPESTIGNNDVPVPIYTEDYTISGAPTVVSVAEQAEDDGTTSVEVAIKANSSIVAAKLRYTLTDGTEGEAELTVNEDGVYIGSLPEETFSYSVSAMSESGEESETELRFLRAFYGDVNGDAKVNAADAALILRMIVKLSKIREDIMRNADVDGDGEITAEDALEIMRYVLRMTDSLPVA